MTRSTVARHASLTHARIRPLAGRLILALASVSLASAGLAAESIPSGSEVKTVKIRLMINGKPTTATLEDNPTALDFLAMLPLTLMLQDHASTEKIAYLPGKLSTRGAPAGIDPEIGDITYYAPWGNLALFYRDFGYSAGLVRLGRFDAGVEVLRTGGSMEVKIEAVGE